MEIIRIHRRLKNNKIKNQKDKKNIGKSQASFPQFLHMLTSCITIGLWYNLQSLFRPHQLQVYEDFLGYFYNCNFLYGLDVQLLNLKIKSCQKWQKTDSCLEGSCTHSIESPQIVHCQIISQNKWPARLPWFDTE